MITRSLLIVALIALPCLASSAEDSTPTHSQIKNWWKPGNRKKPDEVLEIERVYSVRLKSGERAFFASVTFPERAHCCWCGTLLIRPALQEARQIHSIMRVSQVIDLDFDGISEIVITGSSMGQGQLCGSKTVLCFDGWTPVVMHEQSFGNNLGMCGSFSSSGVSCRSKEVVWTFVDLDGDDSKDLVQLLTCGEGAEADQLRWTTKVRVYLLKDKKFVPVEPDLTQSRRKDSRRQEGSRPDDHTDMPNDELRGMEPHQINQPAMGLCPQRSWTTCRFPKRRATYSSPVVSPQYWIKR